MATHKPIKWARVAKVAGAGGWSACRCGRRYSRLELACSHPAATREGRQPRGGRRRPGTERSGVLIGGRSSGHQARYERSTTATSDLSSRLLNGFIGRDLSDSQADSPPSRSNPHRVGHTRDAMQALIQPASVTADHRPKADLSRGGL